MQDIINKTTAAANLFWLLLLFYSYIGINVDTLEPAYI